jgi:hypothetical protein
MSVEKCPKHCHGDNSSPTRVRGHILKTMQLWPYFNAKNDFFEKTAYIMG